MEFYEFLKNYKVKKSFSTNKELFEHFGGENSLGVKQRIFQLYISGKRAPGIKAFHKILECLPLEEYKDAIKSFLFSTCDNSSQASKLNSYLQENLTIKIDQRTPSLWETVDKSILLTESQLRYFNNNTEALRFFDKILLIEKIHMSEIIGKEHILTELINFDLVKTQSQHVVLNYKAVRYPKPENSTRPAVKESIQSMINHISSYVDYEGNSNQVLELCIQMVKKERVPLITSQIQSFHKWIQSLGEVTPDTANSVPIVHVDFFKCLDWKDF